MEQNEINKIENLMSVVKENTCKVPYGINDTNRYEIDNLPYHFTIFATKKENQQIKELQRIFYNEFPKEPYNPDNFIFHITLHIDKDYSKVLELKNILKQNFKPFFLRFNMLALFNYPGDMIKIVK